MSRLPPVIILAGGLGTRIGALYPELPKAMVPINGKPFIAHQLALLSRQSIEEVILCLGHRSESIVKYVDSGHGFGIDVRYSYDGEKLLGTGGAVRKALAVYNLSKPVAVMYGDSYLDTDFASIYDAFLKSERLALMTVFQNNNQWIPSNIVCRSGMVTQYNKEKPTSDMQYVDYGLSFFDPRAFGDVSINKAFDLVDVLQALIQKDQLAAFEVKERFYEVGTAQGLRELESYLTSQGQDQCKKN